MRRFFQSIKNTTSYNSPARPPSTRYRIWKYFQRNKRTAITSAISAFLLVIGLFSSAIFAFIAKQQSNLATATAIRARGETAKSRIAERNAKTSAIRAQKAEALAKTEATNARLAENQATSQARIANGAKHAIQLTLAMESRERGQYEKMGSILNEVHPEYQNTPEHMLVQLLFERENPLIKSLNAFGQGISYIDFSKDSRKVVAGTYEGEVCIWSTLDLADPVRIRAHQGSIEFAHFSDDGMRVVTGSSMDNYERVFNALNGNMVFERKCYFVRSARFSPDGKRIASTSDYLSAVIWNAEDGKELCKLDAHPSVVNDIAFSPNGKFVATGHRNAIASLWHSDSGQKRLDFIGHADEISSVEFSSDGNLLLTGSKDHSARMWNVETGREEVAFMGHEAKVLTATFSQKPLEVITTSEDSTVRQWDIVTGKSRLATKQIGGNVRCIAASGNGRFALVAAQPVSLEPQTIVATELTTGREFLPLQTRGRRLYGAVFSPDSTMLLTYGGYTGPEAHLWSTQKTRQLGSVNPFDIAWRWAWQPRLQTSRDGNLIVVSRGPWTVGIWDLKQNRWNEASFTSEKLFSMAAISPQNDRLLMVTADGAMEMFDTQTGLRFWSLEPGAPTSPLPRERRILATGRRTEWSADGSYIVTTSQGTPIEIRSSVTGEVVATLPFEEGLMLNPRFSPNGEYLVGACTNLDGRTQIKAWRISSARAVATLGESDQKCASIAYSPDGKYLMSGWEDGLLHLWNCDNWTEHGTLKGHDGAIIDAGFSPDGSRIVSVGDDHSIRIWDVVTKQEKLRLMIKASASANNPSSFRTVVFLDDGIQVLFHDGSTLCRLFFPTLKRPL
jgi:WD40 repeat protein